ncbi:ABC transporter permease [Streptomyces sp. NPDC020681]|uniref:ABC transporter permease n=1 Tax=Streptomyces sp. NPDC020681 TaxID=3365083 RepID=UPI00379AA012
MSATPTRRTVAVMVLIPALAALALWAFAWPASRTAPRELPVGVAGPAAAAAQVEQRLEEREGAFDVHRYDDETAARTAIKDRVVYGAVVVTPQGPQLLTASAGSPVVAQLLTQAVTAQAPDGTAVKVSDVVATPAGDPRGSALGSSILPLALAGVAAGSIVTLLGLRGGRAAAALTGAAIVVGLTSAALAHSWLGVLTGNWWAEAGVLGLTVLAVGAGMAGLGALLGTRGLALGGLLMVLLGNPFSGAASAPELLPEPVGMIGQWLPPGAGATLLRSVAYFGGNGAGAAVLTVSLWAALGLAAVLAAGRRGAQRATPAEHREDRLVPVG